MPSCALKTCKNKTSNTNKAKGITFHSIDRSHRQPSFKPAPVCSSVHRFLKASTMWNNSLSLMDVFQELLNAGNSSQSILLDEEREKQLVDVIRQQTAHSADDNMELLTRVVLDAKARMNVTLRPAACGYCEGRLRNVLHAYRLLHGYVSLVVCVVGVIANALNILVLTRKEMAAAPINRLLKWLAVADVCVMLEYIPFTVYKHLILHEKMDLSYGWALYLLFHSHFTQTLHTTSICLTLSLAIWRYIAIKYSSQSHVLCSERRCSIAILTSFLLPPLLCVPTYMVFDIQTKQLRDEHGRRYTAYHVDGDYQRRLFQVNFWVHSVVVKLLPCLVLTGIIWWLVRALTRANTHHRNLRHHTACVAPLNGNNKQLKADKRTDRTTRMLVAVLLLFLLTELPQAVLGLMSGLLGWCFFKRCYDLFGELMDLLALVNGAIDFVLYCAMSRQFRMTFRLVVLRSRKVPAWLAGAPTPSKEHSESHMLNTCAEHVKR